MDPITTAELIAFLSDFFLLKEFSSDVQSSGKNKLKNAIKQHKDLAIINEKLNDLLRRAFKEFDSSTRDEEYSFSALCEFYGNVFLEKLNRYLIASGSDRADIQSDIIEYAQRVSVPDEKRTKSVPDEKRTKANERVEKLTQQVLTTIYDFYRNQASRSERLLAGEIESTVITSATEIKSDIEDLKSIIMSTSRNNQPKDAGENIQGTVGQYSIRPDFINSDRESHKLLKLVFDLQIDRGVIDTLNAIRDVLSVENKEDIPDKCTIIFAQYLLVHYLLSDVRNIPEALDLIATILAFDKVKSDVEFYSDVMIEKAKALVLSGKVAQAHNALKLVKNTDKVGYIEVEGLVLFYEGKAEQAIETLNKGQDIALQDYVTATTEEEKRASYQHYYSILTQLGSLYRCIQRPDLSLSLWKKAVDAANDLGYMREKARTILAYVECLLQYDYLEDAIKELNEAYSIEKNDNDAFFFWHYYNLKAAIHVRRNDQEQDDLKQAIDSLQELLKRGLEANEAIIILRTIAHIQAENGLSKDAKESLEQANQIAEAGEKSNHKKDIEVQLNDIKRGERPFGNDHYRPSVIPPSSEQIKTMIEKYRISEVSLERLRLAFDIGTGYIDIDPNLSYTWLEESKKLANRLLNKHIEARSIIGQAMILFGRKTEESEEKARVIIERAECLMNDIPIWDTRARIMMFKGMALAHIEDFPGAYKCFQEANEILNAHVVKDLDLQDFVADYLDECKIILSRKQFTDFDFETIISELDELKDWFPKYRKELQQFLWYNRHEDIERLIITANGAKAFMISDSKDELTEWIDGLGVLFDIVSFTSETDYHNKRNWNFATMLPVPKNMRSKYFNVRFVLNA